MPPLINLNIFRQEDTNKINICYYAEKYEVNGGVVDPHISKFGKKITRHENPKMNQHDIYEIFKSCKYFYVYENTGLIIEALLSGVIVVVMPASKLNKMDIIYGPEIKWSGIAFGESNDELVAAEKSINMVTYFYNKISSEYELDLITIINNAQSIEYEFKETPFLILSYYNRYVSFLFFLQTIVSAYKINGFLYLISYLRRIIRNFFK